MRAPVAIRHARVHGDGRDGLALRLCVDRLLAASDPAPRRLPPAAILIVQSLRDPLPWRLDTRATVPALAWQRAVSAALDEAAARAVRPAHEAVPAGTGAVVFADRAELLACAARDWCDGSLATRWWWRALGLEVPAALLHAYEETPEAVPAAFAALASRGTLTAFAARIPPSMAAALACAVGTAFDAGPAVEAALGGGSGASTLVIRRARAQATRAQGARVSPPWLDMRSGAVSFAGLAPEQEVLAGIALALNERPAAVRVAAFAQAAAAWREGGVCGPAASEKHGAAPAGPDVPAAAVTPARAGSRRTARSRGDPPRRAGAMRRFTPARGAATVSRKRRQPPAAPGHPASRDEDAPLAQPEAAAGDSLALVVHTRLGGLFHLVLVGQLLELYGDFTTPGRPGIALQVWDFVELLGRRLLQRPPADPVWRLLAELAGRGAGEPPGAGYRPRRTWRVPPAWLASFPDEGTWRHGERDGRVVLIHPGGFAVVDSCRVDVARELRRHGVTRARGGAHLMKPLPALDRWVAHLADYVRARLALALGVPARATPRLVLLRPARVLVTDTRVDVISALRDLPIEIRLAGLDRDPGHVPAAGRGLYFHFE